MSKSQIPYYPLLVELNEANNYSYQVNLRPPISGYTGVKFVGDPGLWISTNIVQTAYVLDQTNVNEQAVPGLVSVGDSKIRYDLYATNITYLKINKYKDSVPQKDTYSLALLFLK